jgi:hypothetical protein
MVQVRRDLVALLPLPVELRLRDFAVGAFDMKCCSLPLANSGQKSAASRHGDHP